MDPRLWSVNSDNVGECKWLWVIRLTQPYGSVTSFMFAFCPWHSSLMYMLKSSRVRLTLSNPGQKPGIRTLAIIHSTDRFGASSWGPRMWLWTLLCSMTRRNRTVPHPCVTQPWSIDREQEFSPEILDTSKDRYTPTGDSKMGVLGTLYANTLLFIAHVSVRLLAPGPETIAAEEHRKEMHEADTHNSHARVYGTMVGNWNTWLLIFVGVNLEGVVGVVSRPSAAPYLQRVIAHWYASVSFNYWGECTKRWMLAYRRWCELRGVWCRYARGTTAVTWRWSIINTADYCVIINKNPLEIVSVKQKILRESCRLLPPLLQGRQQNHRHSVLWSRLLNSAMNLISVFPRSTS